MDLPIIAALATPPGQSGLAVVRLSGSSAAALADRCFAFGPLPSASVAFEGSKVGTTKRHKRSIASMKGYRCALGYLFDPESGEIMRFYAPPPEYFMLALKKAGETRSQEELMECLKRLEDKGE